ncbi:OmpP1/FadL family transporter [Moritella sp. F3]|uniref:OmpP1/FadL family transporter n=1 Tax=Moritella sp. F3 TaxID=2718882 RepID=UPI0018E11424|nr:outer membrane protein transport protein [Moritella sp. F3]GIC76379.1 long-chain fatty acid outer membrane transporter [Moritella sp. F1]GIC80952.1 long-chain fatty acid outer membrane transporter [Moritella sp. F3]
MKRNLRVTSYLGSAIALALATTSVSALAAGFQVGEHSATGLGRANAGEGAIADTALVLTKNPAAMMMFDEITVSSQLAFIAPDVNTDYTDGAEKKTEEDYAPNQFVPSFAAIMPINDKVAVGFAMFSNYGTGTEISDEFAYGDIGGTTGIITIDSSFNIAYKVNDLLSIGAGYDLVVGQAEMKRGFSLGKFDMAGNAIGHGWNVGTLLTFNENNRLALTYRSSVDMGFEGDFSGSGAFSPGESGIFKPADPETVTGTVDITLPAIAELAGYHKLTDIFAVHYSAMWTQWSSLEELKATSNDCGSNPNSPFDPFENGVCFQKDLHYSDSMRYAVGATAYVSESVTLRAGYAYDQQAGEAIVSMPDTNRHQISAGMSYAASETMSFDLGAAYILGEEVTFEEEEGPTANLEEFTSTATAIIVSAQMNMVF